MSLLDELNSETARQVRDATKDYLVMLNILLNKLGGEVSITPKELIESTQGIIEFSRDLSTGNYILRIKK